MIWIDKNEAQPNELSGLWILTYTPDTLNNFRIVRADLWYHLVDSTHWVYLTEPEFKRS